jgi:hypothetical protein
MNNAHCGASQASIEDFRERVAHSLGASSAVLLNLIDVLAIGPRPGTPVEVTLSHLWGYAWCSLYQALRRAGQELAPTIEDPDWLRQLRSARLAWLQEQGAIAVGAGLGAWRVRILDATNYHRPQTRTVEIGVTFVPAITSFEESLIIPLSVAFETSTRALAETAPTSMTAKANVIWGAMVFMGPREKEATLMILSV